MIASPNIVTIISLSNEGQLKPPFTMQLELDSQLQISDKSRNDLKKRLGNITVGDKEYRAATQSKVQSDYSGMQMTIHYKLKPEKDLKLSGPATKLEVITAMMFGSITNQNDEDLRLQEAIRMARKLIRSVDKSIDKECTENNKL